MASTAAVPQSFAPDDLQLAPLLDDASILDQTFFDPFSLDLPPLQDASQTRSSNFNITDTIQPRPLSPTHPKDVLRASAKEPNHPSDRRKDAQPLPKAKTSMPLTEVLNNENLTIDPMSILKSQTTHTQGSYFPKKRRRLEEESPLREDFVHLPRPEPLAGSEHQQPRIPPLLQGLHEPPPNAALFPPITDEKPLRSVTSVVEETLRLQHEAKHPLARQASPDSQYRPSSTGFREQPQDVTNPAIDPALCHDTTMKSPLHPPKQQNKAPSPSPTPTSNPIPIQKSLLERPRRRTKEPKSIKRSQSALNRKKWSEDETRDLLHGVKRFGVGKWKEILECEEYCFDGRRTVVDLKDKFRVCRPRLDREESGDTERNTRIGMEVRVWSKGDGEGGVRKILRRQARRGSGRVAGGKENKEIEGTSEGAEKESRLLASNVLQDAANPDSGAERKNPQRDPTLFFTTQCTQQSRARNHKTHVSARQSSPDNASKPRASFTTTPPDLSGTDPCPPQQKLPSPTPDPSRHTRKKQTLGPPARRPRHTFTPEEDAALLAGFRKHGPLWARIRADEEGDGVLRERLPRDLRDRLRNRWPGLFGRRKSAE